jgi:hypothetical protein
MLAFVCTRSEILKESILDSCEVTASLSFSCDILPLLSKSLFMSESLRTDSCDTRRYIG